MKKAWEEDWKIETDEVGEHLALPDDHGFPVVVRGPWTHEGQLRLASAAPDMGRVLLALEWSAEVFVDYDASIMGCPSCGGAKDPFSAWKGNPPADPPRVGHAPDCKLDAAIRKAGIR